MARVERVPGGPVSIWRKLSAPPSMPLRRVRLRPDIWREQAKSMEFFRSGMRTFAVWHVREQASGAAFNEADGDPERRAAMKKSVTKYDNWYERIQE